MTQRQSNGMATAALVLGIVSIVTGFFGWIGIICGILAIIFSILAKKKIKENSALLNSVGAANAGLITGIIGLVLGIAMTIVALLFLSAVVKNYGNDFEDAFDQLEQEMENVEREFDENQ